MIKYNHTAILLTFTPHFIKCFSFTPSQTLSEHLYAVFALNYISIHFFSNSGFYTYCYKQKCHSVFLRRTIYNLFMLFNIYLNLFLPFPFFTENFFIHSIDTQKTFQLDVSVPLCIIYVYFLLYNLHSFNGFFLCNFPILTFAFVML